MAAELGLPPPSTKRCYRCQRELPLDQFHKHRRAMDGLDGNCRECNKVIRAASYRRNAAKVKARVAAYGKANAEKVSERKRTYYKANAERLVKRHADYYKANKEQLDEWGVKYRKTIPGFVSRLWRNINSRTINGSHPQWSNPGCRRYLERRIRLEMTRDELTAKVEEYWPAIKAMWAAGQTPTIDRIDSNGHYSADNIQFISWSENSRKSGLKTNNFRSNLE